jgi:hypothetical protein
MWKSSWKSSWKSGDNLKDSVENCGKAILMSRSIMVACTDKGTPSKRYPHIHKDCIVYVFDFGQKIRYTVLHSPNMQRPRT